MSDNKTTRTGNKLRPLFVHLYGEHDATPADVKKSVYCQLGFGTRPLGVKFDNKNFSDKRIVVCDAEHNEQLYPLSPVGDKFNIIAPLDIKEDLDGEFQGDLRIGSFALIVSSNKILLVEKKSAGGNFWYIPGGLCEFRDESLVDTAKRETFEETGVLCGFRQGRPLCMYESVTTTRSGNRHNLMAVIEWERIMSDLIEVKDREEIASAEWMDVLGFYKEAKYGRIKTMPSMLLLLDKWVERRFKESIEQEIRENLNRRWRDFSFNGEPELPTLAKLMIIKDEMFEHTAIDFLVEFDRLNEGYTRMILEYEYASKQ